MTARRLHCLYALVAVFAALPGASSAPADEPAIPASLPREAWTTSRIVGTPEPPLPYRVEAVWPEFQFVNPVDWAVEPGTGRIFVLQLDGKLFAFRSDVENPALELVYDVAAHEADHQNSYGIAFHPDYERNRQVFLSYVLPPENPVGSHVSRFRMLPGESPRLDADSEEILFTWPSGGHNGACLKFGPDGMFYISTGDGVGPFPPDAGNVGQDLSDVRSTILRIDVDHPEADRAYGIPDDNPFVDLDDARGEVWAYGFRNPWKMNFDPFTGDLWCGDVGWELWELVFRVERGGNYGWSIMEGPQPVRSDLPRGPTPIQPPIAAHPHTESRSVTGGFVYRGTELPELRGAYIYGDYVTGKIWGLRTEGSRLVWHEELADTPLAIITFGEDAAGELYVVDYAGTIHRLVPNPARDQPADFPRTLGETGLFSDVANHQPAPGVIPYVLQTQQWADGATAEQFLALPGTSSIEFQRNREQWGFPPGTVFAKTISLRLDETKPDFAHRLETQILHYDGEAWQPYTYVWNDDQTDAELAPAEGLERTFSIRDRELPSGARQLTWRFHSRAECSTCHVPRAGDAIGFTIANLNRDHSLWGVHANQLDLFAAAGVFDRPVDPQLRSSAMADLRDETAPIETRARSYLAINCAHCHRRGGGGTAHIEFPFEHSDDQIRTIDELPTQGTFGLPQARLIAPNDVYRSVLYYRMATVGRGHMPKLGPRNADDAGVDLIAEWIRSLPPSAQSLPAGLAESQQHEVELMRSLDTSGNPENETLTALLSSTSGAMRLVDTIAGGGPDAISDAAIEQGAAHTDPVIRGLFERFLPEERRSRALGTVVDRSELLSLEGDIGRGRELFFNAEGVQCRTCHQIEGRGKIVGPDLSHIAKDNSAAQILEAILDPSAKIDAKFVSHALVTTDGRVLTGVLLERTEDLVRLRDAQGNEHAVARDEIEELASQPRSLMPELLLQEMTPEEVSDLLAFLASLE